LTAEDYAKSKENELLANLQLHEDKKLSDRTNWFTVVETIFFSAFVGLIQDPKGLPGLYEWFPLIICGAGIVVSILWFYMSKIQIEEIIKPLREKIADRMKAQPSFKTYFNIAANKKSRSLANVLYRLLPIVLGIVWVLLLIVYSLHMGNLITI